MAKPVLANLVMLCLFFNQIVYWTFKKNVVMKYVKYSLRSRRYLVEAEKLENIACPRTKDFGFRPLSAWLCLN